MGRERDGPDGEADRVIGPALAAATCARRLAGFGLAPGAVDYDISWHGPARLGPLRPGSEATVQALSGLMAVHGRDDGRPRRLGLEAGSVAAGLLAAQAVLAVEVGRLRGCPVARVETSVLQATNLLLSHYLAAATAVGDVVPPSAGTAPGPPFQTSDDRWFEIEVFDADAWKAFWSRLGAPAADLGGSWTAFRARYYRGTCRLTPGLHRATRSHSFDDAAAAAAACGVSLCRVRTYSEVLEEPGRSCGNPSIGSDFGPAGPGVAQEAVIGPAGPGVAQEAVTGPGSADATSSTGSPLTGMPLEGIRVVEATSRMQGPLAGLLCQMLGAEVVRIEPPGGDVGRMVPPFAGEVGSFFQCFNRGKDTLELDLGQERQRRELADLVVGADVFLHNWRPGKAAEWGLDAADLSSRNPALVYVQASGWGGRPEDGRLIGTDFLVQAFTGAGNGVRPDDEPPWPTRVLLADFMGALVTCEGMIGGLFRREERGRGGRVETSLLQGAMALQAHVLDGVANELDGAAPETGRRRGRPVWGPLDRPLECSDGTLVVSAEGDAALARLCELSDVADDGGPREHVESRVAQELQAGPAAKWADLLTDGGIPAEVASTDLSSLHSDPRFEAMFEPLSETCFAPRGPWSLS